MTSKEFWQDDPNLFVSYQTFFINKKKRESEEENYNAWLFGLYEYIAFNTTLSNAFREKGEKAKNYLEKPIDFKSYNKNNEQKNLEEKLKANLRHYSRRKNFLKK